MKKLAALSILVQLYACTGNQPPAELAFVDVAPLNGNFQVTFQSNVQFFELFSKNQHQRPVLSELACSLGVDRNFEFEHRLEHFGRGDVEIAAGPAGSGAYRFQSTFQFWRAPKERMGSDEMLTDAELVAVLRARKTIPCIVRMTIYLSQPYYTKPMQVPVERILAAMPNEAAHPTRQAITLSKD